MPTPLKINYNSSNTYTHTGGCYADLQHSLLASALLCKLRTRSCFGQTLGAANGELELWKETLMADFDFYHEFSINNL